MSIQSEITRISGNVADALTAVAAKGVTVPTGSNSDDLADLISAIPTGSGSAITITDETDSHGGTIRTITAVSLDGDTVRPDVLLSGYTAHNALGEAIVGTASGGGSPTLQSKTATPTESTQTITPDTGYDGLSEVEVDAISSDYVGSGIDRRDGTDLTASGATVSVPAGYYSASTSKSISNGSVTAPSSITASSASVSAGTNTLTLSKTVSVTPTVTTAGYISSGTAGNASVSLTASVNTRSSSSLTVNGATVTAPSGYYASSASTSVASGSAGTPTATKGTASNHSVSVTPSVTNTTGYITGGTKTGTAVTVSASELVSGSETKTENGTYDVTNLAELIVNVSGGGSGKNAQIQSKVTRTASSSYVDAGFELTVSKAGKYNVYWVGYRSSTSGTSGSQLYVNGTASGSAITTFDSTYTNVQIASRTNVSLALNDKLTIRARSRSTSYYMYIMNLTIIEV